MYPFINEKKPFSGVPDAGYTYPGIPGGTMTKAKAPDIQIGSGKKLAQSTYTANPFEQMFLQERQRSQEEIEKEQRRLAARSTVNSLGMIVKTLANLYGASKGAIVNPVQDTISPQISQELSALKERKYNEERQQHAQKLQLALNEYSRTQDRNEYLNRFNLQQDAENRRDERNYGQQKEIIGLQDQLTDKRYSRELADKQKQDERNFAQQKELIGEQYKKSIAQEDYRTGKTKEEIQSRYDAMFDYRKKLQDAGLNTASGANKSFTTLYTTDPVSGAATKYKDITEAEANTVLIEVLKNPDLMDEEDQYMFTGENKLSDDQKAYVVQKYWQIASEKMGMNPDVNGLGLSPEELGKGRKDSANIPEFLKR